MPITTIYTDADQQLIDQSEQRIQAQLKFVVDFYKDKVRPHELGKYIHNDHHLQLLQKQHGTLIQTLIPKGVVIS